MLSMQATMATCWLWHFFAHWELLVSPGLEAPTTSALAASISMRALPPAAALASEDMAATIVTGVIRSWSSCRVLWLEKLEKN